jgi:ketosteroid isomerase-like protein
MIAAEARTLEDNKAAARAFMQATVKGEVRDDMLAEDFVFWNAITGELPRETILSMPNALKEGIKGELRITETGITAEGNKVAIEAVSEAELKSGERYGNVYHFLFEFAPDGRINRMAEHLDSSRVMPLLKALGLV